MAVVSKSYLLSHVAAAAVGVALSFGLGAGVLQAEVPAYVQSLGESVSEDAAISAFYQGRNFAPIWTGAQDAARRSALLNVLARAGDHGLPVSRYDAGALVAAIEAVKTEGDRGRIEAALTRAFLAYAHDVKSGVLEPAKVDPGILRVVERPDEARLLAAIAGADPMAVLLDLPPKAPEYARLMKEKLALQGAVAAGWGPEVAAEKLEPGDTGPAVIALRDRLVALGYMPVSATAVYDAAITAAVQRFQSDHGLLPDGVAGAGTVAEINIGPEARLKSVVVAMERLRWMGDFDRSGRYIWVNQPDFTAQIIDHGRVTFQTRSVVGKNSVDTRSPEFSDQMEHMIVNPSWGVPRSIIVKEYLPLLQQNPQAVGHLQVVDRQGRVVPREQIDFASFTAKSFPFGLRQPPSDGNALGKVKFMFPNPYNIYLHDTPAKDLFAKEVRAYSHGCIRLADPFDFAYALLSAQSDDPKGVFKAALDRSGEQMLKLDRPVPVHLVYFTAWPTSKGQMTWRRDVYGRDGRIFDALTEAGVVLGGVQG
ncbi:L,D-transpeptidase family protein [Paragemmobacter straminiformis]|uniref:L,D-transpeptidase family protein n=1 Tax=Paragemmobacter straminiformis TaxID=2045119 RepID=A0A842I728_9RHOB|nr:L,D-transpeptidase family protein [Gemmobacter straminiformis]MBC2835439.1 L,D-transpeptidase family protein [Gemmobacter straminiformis]